MDTPSSNQRDPITCDTIYVTNYCLTRFTCILFLLLQYIYISINLFYVPRVFLLSALQHYHYFAIGGVGLLIEPRALKSLNSIEKIQRRMMVATFNGNPSATIISCYSLINVSEETDLIAFYNELSSLVRSMEI